MAEMSTVFRYPNTNDTLNFMWYHVCIANTSEGFV